MNRVSKTASHNAHAHPVTPHPSVLPTLPLYFLPPRHHYSNPYPATIHLMPYQSSSQPHAYVLSVSESSCCCALSTSYSHPHTLTPSHVVPCRRRTSFPAVTRPPDPHISPLGPHARHCNQYQKSKQPFPTSVHIVRRCVHRRSFSDKVCPSTRIALHIPLSQTIYILYKYA